MARGPVPKGVQKVRPWHPSDWELADANALQALARGDAASHLQQRALKFIVETLADTYGLSYRADSDRDTAFAEGKRWVGLQIVKLLKTNIGALKDA